MSQLKKLWMPEKFKIAALVMIVTLVIACAVEYFTGFATIRFVMTVVYYLILDYAWATLKREWSGGRF